MNSKKRNVLVLCTMLATLMIVQTGCVEQESGTSSVGVEQGEIGLSSVCEDNDADAIGPQGEPVQRGNSAGNLGADSNNVDGDNAVSGACDGDECCHSHCDDDGCCHTHCHENTCIDGDCDADSEQVRNQFQHRYQHRYRNCKGQYRWCHSHCHGDGNCHSHCHGHGCCYCNCQGEGNCHCYCRGCNDECGTDPEDGRDTHGKDSDDYEDLPTDNDYNDNEDENEDGTSIVV